MLSSEYSKVSALTHLQSGSEQCGYVVSGRHRLIIESDPRIDVVLTAGDSYAIPGNTLHSFEVMEDGEVVDVFTPHREDYL